MGRTRAILFGFLLLLSTIPGLVRADDDGPPPPTALAEKLSEHLSNPNDAQLVKDITSELLQMTDKIASEREATPLLRRCLDFAVDHAIEFISIPSRLRELRAGARSLVVKYGVIPVSMYISGEIFEAVIAPFVLNALGGKWAMALTPLFHPNDVLFPPALVAYLKLVEKRKRWQLAAPEKFLGNRHLYRELRKEWEAKLGGDPEPIVYTAHLNFTSKRGPGEPTHELQVSARAPAHAPLHALGGLLSLRDLKKILGRPMLEKELRRASGEDRRLYGHLMLSACLDDEAARARLSEKLRLGPIPETAWLDPQPPGSAIHAAPGSEDFARLVRSRLVWRDSWNFRAGGIETYLKQLDDKPHRQVLRILASAWRRLAEQKNELSRERELLEYRWLRSEAERELVLHRSELDREAETLERKANSILRNQEDIEFLAGAKGAIEGVPSNAQPEAIRKRLSASLGIGPGELPLGASARERLSRTFSHSVDAVCWALRQLGESPLYR